MMECVRMISWLVQLQHCYYTLFFFVLTLSLSTLLSTGVDVSTGQLRSLPLPNLDRVTRQAAQEYFDNSWTLYETLFAGLKGEEGFYR